MKKIHLLTFLLLIAFIPFMGFCTILHVPATYSSIQSGIDAAVNGDVVLVEPNTYYENLNLYGKNIILCSNFFTTGNSAFIATTIIDGSNVGRVVTISSGESSACQVIGFTIQHGNSSSEYGLTYGGGIFISDASPQIMNCIIKNNYAPGYGGGLAINGLLASANIIECTIQNNSADNFGGGVFMGDCNADAQIVNSIITGNTITCNCDFNGGGGGVNLYHAAKLVNCLIANNSAPNAQIGGGGVYCDWGDYYGSQGIFVTGCTIVNNTALNWGGTANVIDGGEFRNCILWGNTNTAGDTTNYDGSSFINCSTSPLPAGTGNISSNPDFINPAAGNFRLANGSPCIDAGDNSFNTQMLDLDGNPRISNNLIDMGAYENGTGTGVTVQIGSGTDATGTLPINSCYSFNYSQQIYLGSEITSGGASKGLISKVRFYYAGGGSQFSHWNNWTVYLGNTSKTEFAGISDWIPATAMKQVFSGLIPNPVEGTWMEITLPVPFYYSGNSIVVAVDENSSGNDCTAQWGSFYSGAPRGLLTYSDNTNPDPTSPPNAIFDPDWNIAQVQFQIDTVFGVLKGQITELPDCTVPIMGATILAGTCSTTSDASGYYLLNLPVGTYSNISAIYHDASQTVSPATIAQGDSITRDFCISPYYAPPIGLQASINGPLQNNVHLTWLPPGSIADQWIRWDNGQIYGGLGYYGPTIFSVASRWPIPDITPYGGSYLKKIRFAPNEATASYTLKVWKGTNASTLLLSQVVDNPIIGGWNEVTLSTPVLIDGTEEFWFGYEINQTMGYPAGLGSGPAVTGKGDMINSGGDWFSVKEAWGWEFNWTLEGFVSENPVLAAQQAIPMVQKPSPPPIMTTPISSSVKPRFILSGQTPSGPLSPALPVAGLVLPRPVFPASHTPLTTMTGYNVYRNGEKIADNIPGLNYDDLALAKGGYDYAVAAQYDFGESVWVGPVHVDVYTCFPPTNLTVSNTTLTTTSAELSWTPSTISTNLQWMIEWGPSGFTPGYGTTALVNTTPEYPLTNLNPGAEYDFYVSTYCSPTDASARVKKTFRTHYFNCPAGATPEFEVCGTNTNGCDQVPPAFEAISFNETVCGTSWLSRTHRDSDWYSFTLTQPMDVTLTGNAEFTYTMNIASAPCPSTTVYSTMNSGAGYTNSITTQLIVPGTYFIYVAPSYAEQVACDSLNRYWITLTGNNCLTPVALNAVNITSTSADLEWTSNSGLWNIEWGLAGFSRGTGTMISATGSNPYHLSGLLEGYAYSYYVQGDCGNGSTSYWAGPFTFFLPCSAATNLPFTEHFTSQAVGISPQCWQVHGAGGSTNWVVAESNNAGGSAPELTFLPYNNYFSGRSYMTSPVINSAGMAELDISFKQSIYAYSSGTTCELWTTSDGGITWHSLWSAALNGALGPQTLSFPITTPDVGSATFQFAFAVNGNSWDIGSWQIDDISLLGIPQTGTLQGIVTDCSHASLLQGVSVAAGLSTTTTDASGFYQFLNIPVGAYDVQFSMTGYVSKSVPGTMVLNGMTTTLDTCLTLTGPPPVAIVQNETVPGGQSKCYDATQTITVAGSGTTFTVENQGVATMIAGISIDYLPGTHIKPGGYMHGTIALHGPFCGLKSASIVTADLGVDVNPLVVEKPAFRIYPNPTAGKFRMELTGKLPTEQIRVEIYNMRGEKILSESLSGETAHEFSLADKPAGVYFIKVVAGETIFTSKLIKTR